MVRIFKQHAEIALMALEWCRYQGYGAAQIRKDLGGRYPDNSQNIVYRKVMAAYANYDGRTTTEETAKLIAEALSADARDMRGERELIDRIVDVLKLPYSKNVLAGSSLKSLTQAILIPDELIGLSERLKKGEMSCCGCGHDFIEGEMGVIYKGDSGRNGWLCTNCNTPKYMACGCKSKSMKLPEKMLDSFKTNNVKCDSCLSKGVKKSKGLGSVAGAGIAGGDIQIGALGDDLINAQQIEDINVQMRNEARIIFGHAGDGAGFGEAPAGRQGRVRAVDPNRRNVWHPLDPPPVPQPANPANVVQWIDDPLDDAHDEDAAQEDGA